MDQDKTTMSVSEVKSANDEEKPGRKTTTTVTATPEVPTAQMATLKVGSATSPPEEKVEAKDNKSKIDEIIDTASSIINPETGEVEMMDFEQEEVEKILKKIGRAELEDIILQKIVEAVNAQTVVGDLSAQCLRLHGLTDKLVKKSGVLENQVAVMSEALKVYEDNASLEPSQQKPPPRLNFYRSVGLQVNVEKSTTRTPKTGVNNTPRMTNSNATAFMQQISNGPLSSTTSNASSPNNNNILSPQNGGMKRVNQPTSTVAELRNQVGRPEQPKMDRSNSNTSMAIAAPRQHQAIMPMPRNPAAGTAMTPLNAATAANAGKKATTSGLIDLTEDNNNGGGLVLNQNGLKYRVLNEADFPPGMQLVSSSTGYHLVSPQGQSRPVVFKHAGTGRLISPSQTQTTTPSHGISRPAGMQQQQQQQRMIPPPNRVITTRAPVPNKMKNGHLVGQGAPQVTPMTRLYALPVLPSPTTPTGPDCSKTTKEKPPRPALTLEEKDGKIVLSWTHVIGQNHAEISSYQIFACQQPLNPNGNVIAPAWKVVGHVKALALPMVCTLSKLSDENRYHFVVRGLDVYNRSGPFSELVSIVLRKKC